MFICNCPAARVFPHSPDKCPCAFRVATGNLDNCQAPTSQKSGLGIRALCAHTVPCSANAFSVISVQRSKYLNKSVCRASPFTEMHKKDHAENILVYPGVSWPWILTAACGQPLWLLYYCKCYIITNCVFFIALGGIQLRASRTVQMGRQGGIVPSSNPKCLPWLNDCLISMLNSSHSFYFCTLHSVFNYKAVYQCFKQIKSHIGAGLSVSRRVHSWPLIRGIAFKWIYLIWLVWINAATWTQNFWQCNLPWWVLHV